MLHETQTSGSGTETVRAFWKSYNVMDAIENTKSAWDEVRNTTLSAAWKNIWPECCQISSTSILSSPSEAQNDIQEEILQVGRSLDGERFAHLDVQDIEEVINAYNAELSTVELCSQYGDISLITQEESEVTEVSCKDKLTIAKDFRNGGPLNRRGM
ncbi:putative DDE superfamily endonuclease [Trypoxylus dichotomus]